MTILFHLARAVFKLDEKHNRRCIFYPLFIYLLSVIAVWLNDVSSYFSSINVRHNRLIDNAGHRLIVLIIRRRSHVKNYNKV